MGMSRKQPRKSVGSIAMMLALVGGTLAGLPAAALAATTLVDCSSDPSALQPAIDAAEPGDALEITGSCVGNFIIDRDLTLQGTGTLNGNGAGTVLQIDSGSTVAIIDLTITNGVGSVENSLFLVLSGGGIYNRGTLTLDGSTSVVGNSAVLGGGIFNDAGGSLSIGGSVTVTRNTASSGGGGIFTNFFSGVTLKGSAAVTGNSAAVGGGISNWDRTVMNESSTVAGNTADSGGGIFDRGHVAMNDSASVRDNAATSNGGGIDIVFGRSVTVNDSASLSGNSATHGGGISGAGDIVLNGSASVSGNTASRNGGGISGATSTTLNGSASINGNSAGTKDTAGRGGGIWTDFGGITLNDRTMVQGNKAIGPGADGGGIFVCNAFDQDPSSLVNLNGGRVKSNKPNDISIEAENCF
jgi:predicted outer membrane repeat protein